jgi:hypothetical protein
VLLLESPPDIPANADKSGAEEQHGNGFGNGVFNDKVLTIGRLGKPGPRPFQNRPRKHETFKLYFMKQLYPIFSSHLHQINLCFGLQSYNYLSKHMIYNLTAIRHTICLLTI